MSSTIKARDLRIGDTIGRGALVTALHELCAQRPSPHVHAITSGGVLCMDFGTPVERQAVTS